MHLSKPEWALQAKWMFKVLMCYVIIVDPLILMFNFKETLLTLYNIDKFHL